MSVLSCSRRGCEHIMCDRYSSEYGYLCHSCFDELVDRGIDTNIDEFMNTMPGSDSNDTDPYDFFSEVFKLDD